MSADGYAELSGSFAIQINDHAMGAPLGWVYVRGLRPYQAVAYEIILGTDFLPDEARAVTSAEQTGDRS